MVGDDSAFRHERHHDRALSTRHSPVVSCEGHESPPSSDEGLSYHTRTARPMICLPVFSNSASVLPGVIRAILTTQEQVEPFYTR